MDSPSPYLQINPDASRLSHAYITGKSLTGKLAMAAVCSGQSTEKPCMLCTNCGKASRGVHPDITVVEKQPDKRDIVVEQIRVLKKDVIVVPVESAKKVYIIDNADLMNISAQNAFLQLLEEPPGHAVFILSTETPSALLQTVRSRCVELKSGATAEEPGADADETAKMLFSAIERGNIELADLMFRLEKLDKDAFGRFLAAAKGQAALKLRAGSPGAGPARGTIALLERTLEHAEEMQGMNVSAGHISGLICATLIRDKNHFHNRKFWEDL